MRTTIILLLAFGLGGCASTIDTGSEPAVETSAPTADAGVTDATHDAVDLCGDVVLQKHWGEPCVASSECVTKGIGNACICGLCVVSY